MVRLALGKMAHRELCSTSIPAGIGSGKHPLVFVTEGTSHWNSDLVVTAATSLVVAG
jgi:hypothetical protein